MIPQSTFMLMATIAPDREADLRALLTTLNQAPGLAKPDNQLIPFAHFAQLHVARFVIIRANTNDDIRAHGVTPSEWLPRLAFVGDIDGDRALFFAELVQRAEPGLRQIFSHCLGFDEENTELLPWLHRNNYPPTANYVNWIGRTVVQIKQEQVLVGAINNKLTELAVANPNVFTNPRRIHQEIKTHIEQEVATLRLRLNPVPATPAAWWLKNVLHLLVWPLIALLLTPLLLLLAPFYFFYLRRLEKSDPENTQRPDAQHLQNLMQQEDIDVSNHFNVFGQVKPGLFRRLTIKLLLGVLNYASRHIYKRGYLTRIQTIHFARWVLLDDGKRVYFASNYDGSADSYMDDFINKVAWGLNLVFSNGVGYPRTRYLVKGGAEFEGKYKKTLRRNQLPSESWYKAYPGLTAVDLARNARIRKVLQKRHPSVRQLNAWLGDLELLSEQAT